VPSTGVALELATTYRGAGSKARSCHIKFGFGRPESEKTKGDPPLCLILADLDGRKREPATLSKDMANSPQIAGVGAEITFLTPEEPRKCPGTSASKINAAFRGCSTSKGCFPVRLLMIRKLGPVKLYVC
jgi:hypothetical protein